MNADREVTATFTRILQPLSVTTIPAGNLNSTSATLNGALTALGANASVAVYFEWGETTGYGNTTHDPAHPRTLTAPGSFSHTLGGLASGRTYHYRAVAQAGDTTVKGEDGSFIPENKSSGGGGGGKSGGTPSRLTVSLTGLSSTASLITDTSGVVKAGARLKNEDGTIGLDIAQGTMLQDAGGKALRNLSASPLSPLPDLTGDTVLIAGFRLGPAGARFTPSLTLTFNYDPAGLPDGASEPDLYLAYRDGSQWVKLESRVNGETRTVSAEIGHFSEYALLAKIPPLPASFTVTDLRVTPSEISPGSPAAIRATVTNTGGMQGAYLAVFRINGIPEERREVTLEAGEAEIVEFQIQPGAAGEYFVEVNEISGHFIVKAPVAPAIEKESGPEPVKVALPVDADTPLSSPEPISEKVAPDKSSAQVIWTMVGILAAIGILTAVILTWRRKVW